jgi:nicotinate-nucleotide pyrophosphorylase (carboxylating)
MSHLPPLPPTEVARLVESALAEDLRSGDATSAACVPAGSRGGGRLVAREGLVVAGLEVAEACFRRLDPDCAFEVAVSDGRRARAGAAIAAVEGDLRALLAAERTALNVLQRACGIATRTRQLVDLVADLGVDLLDTRKTAPGLRLLDKHAVRAGGGVNHRFALDDLLMVKDNHVVAAGSLEAAVERALAAAGHAHLVEVEVDTLEQLDALLRLPRLPQLVLLDNFTPDAVGEAVTRVAGRMRVEVSGGVTEATLRAHAEAGPDAISMGALTHSVRAADLAFDLDRVPG